MKSTAMWVLRHLLIPVGFVWATGIFYGIHYMNTTSSAYEDPYSTFTKEEFATLEITPQNAIAYGDSLVKQRKSQIEKTGIYDPYLYFHDLKQYNMFEKMYSDSLSKTGEGKLILMESTGIGFSSKSALVNLRDDNWRKVDIDAIAAKNYTEDAGYGKKITGIDEARHYWFPAAVLRDKENAAHPINFLPDILMPLLLWLLRVYLRGLCVAFVLFLLWRMRFKKEFAEATWYEPNAKEMPIGFTPLSFLVSLLFWPVILWKDIKNRGSATLRKAEVLSRRNNMFSLLTKGDEALLALGKSMSLKEFRLHLDSSGITRKHSFATAISVAMLLTLMPHLTVPTVTAHEHSSKQVIVTNIDYGGTHVTKSLPVHEISSLEYEAALVDTTFFVTVCVKNIIVHFSDTAWKILKGFLRDIGGVPKFQIIFS